MTTRRDSFPAVVPSLPNHNHILSPVFLDGNTDSHVMLRTRQDADHEEPRIGAVEGICAGHRCRTSIRGKGCSEWKNKHLILLSKSRLGVVPSLLLVSQLIVHLMAQGSWREVLPLHRASNTSSNNHAGKHTPLRQCGSTGENLTLMKTSAARILLSRRTSADTICTNRNRC